MHTEGGSFSFLSLTFLLEREPPISSNKGQSS